LQNLKFKTLPNYQHFVLIKLETKLHKASEFIKPYLKSDNSTETVYSCTDLLR